MSSTALQLIEFDGHPLTLLIIDGRPAMLARQLGAALGYQDEGKRFATQITGEWADEFVEGQDHQHATQPTLKAAFSRAGNYPAREESAENAKGTDSVPLGSPRGALVLFESGIYLACLLSKKDAGRRLRRKLADEVFPQLARDGRYDPERRVSPETGAIEGPPARDELTDLRQRIDLAQGLIASLPEGRRAAATEALLQFVVPGLKLPAVAPAPAGKAPSSSKTIGTLSPEAALAKIVTWARANRDQLWSVTLARTTRAWLGRWDEGDDLYLTRPALLAALGGADLHALERAWTRAGVLVPEEVGRYSMRVRVDGVRRRCFRFSASRLPHI